MMLSLIFIVGFFSLLLLPITCLSVLLALEPQHSAATASDDDKPQLSSIWRLLLDHVMFPGATSARRKAAAAQSKEDGAAGVRRLAGRREAGEECRVCLCEVEQGEEVSDLRCKHLFHKVCLDSWIGSGHATCPLCRGRVFAPALSEGAGSSELLFFQFSSLAGSRRSRRDGNWWIR